MKEERGAPSSERPAAAPADNRIVLKDGPSVRRETETLGCHPGGRKVVGATGFEPATPCAQGEGTHTTGGSGRPLPLVFLRKFSIWGNCSKPRATTDCQPIVSQRLIEDAPKERSSQSTDPDLQSPAISNHIERVVRLWISILVGMMTHATMITATIFEGRNQDVS